MRFRLGYSHNRDEGPGFFTTDSGTISDFTENYSYTTNAYRVGVDFRILPRTTISYDQFLNYFKQDNVVSESPTVTPQNFGFVLGTVSRMGTPAARRGLGIIWSTQTPPRRCLAPLRSRTPQPTPPRPNCNGFLSYSQVGRPRNFMPTERLRFQSNYFKKFEMSGSVGYSSSDNRSRTSTRSERLDSADRNAREHDGRAGQSQARFRECGLVRRVRRDRQIPHPGYRSATTIGASPASGPRLRRTSSATRLGQVGLALLACCNQVHRRRSTATNCPAAPYNQAGCPHHTASSGADVTNETRYAIPGAEHQVEYLRAPI